MCISCGCNHPADNHGDRRNITLQDIDAAAQAAGTTREKVLQNISDVAQSSRQSDTSSSRPRQDGYLETQGENYGRSEEHYGEPASSNPAQQGYDPAHSGARQAKNRPGTRVETPGRETGTSWGEDQQMGTTTDTPDRRNPAS
jgi:hypothetical protein